MRLKELLDTSEIIMKIFDLFVLNKAFKINDESLFLKALKMYSLQGKFSHASRIFMLYEKIFGFVDNKAYPLLLNSFITAIKSEKNLNEVLRSENLNEVTNYYDQKVSYLLEYNKDQSAALSNLILQFYIARQELSSMIPSKSLLSDTLSMSSSSLPPILQVQLYFIRMNNANITLFSSVWFDLCDFTEKYYFALLDEFVVIMERSNYLLPKHVKEVRFVNNYSVISI